MSADFNLAEKEPFPEVFDTVWTDSKRGALNSCESGKPKAFSTPGRPYAVALSFICCGQFAGRLSPSVIKFGVIFFTQ